MNQHKKRKEKCLQARSVVDLSKKFISWDLISIPFMYVEVSFHVFVSLRETASMRVG